MRRFWRRHRALEGISRSRGEHPAGACTERLPGLRTDGDDAVTAVQLYDRDWDQMGDFLASSGNCDTGALAPAAVSNAPASSLMALRGSLDGQTMPAGPVVDRLLDVWAAVHEVDPEAARPVERLLSSLVKRQMVRAREVTEMCDQVDAALAIHPERAMPCFGKPDTGEPGRTAEARPVPTAAGRLHESTSRSNSSHKGAQ
jgi:hypothetical protein